jgi:hypothetical protein
MPWGYSGVFELNNGGGLFAKEFETRAAKAIWDFEVSFRRRRPKHRGRTLTLYLRRASTPPLVTFLESDLLASLTLYVIQPVRALLS